MLTGKKKLTKKQSKKTTKNKQKKKQHTIRGTKVKRE